MQISPRIPWYFQPLPFQGGITVLLESLHLITGDMHTMQAKSSHSTFFPVLLLLYSMWKVFQTNTQVQKSIAQEMSASLGRHRAKRICSTPVRHLEGSSQWWCNLGPALPWLPPFMIRRGLCIALLHSLQDWVSNWPSELTGAQPSPQSHWPSTHLQLPWTNLAGKFS